MRNQPFFDLLFEIEFSIYILINFRLKPIINLKMQSPSTFLQTAANYLCAFLHERFIFLGHRTVRHLEIGRWRTAYKRSRAEQQVGQMRKKFGMQLLRQSRAIATARHYGPLSPSKVPTKYVD